MKESILEILRWYLYNNDVVETSLELSEGTVFTTLDGYNTTKNEPFITVYRSFRVILLYRIFHTYETLT